MVQLALALSLAFSASLSSHAAVGGDSSSNVTQLGRTRGPQGAAAVKILFELERVYMDLVGVRVPPFVKAYVLRNQSEIAESENWVARYGSALKLGLRGASLLDVAPDLETAHEYAVAQVGPVEPEPVAHTEPGADPETARYKAAFVPLEAFFKTHGVDPLPKFVRAFGLALVDGSRTVSEVHLGVAAYKLAFEFAHAPLEAEGLGLDVAPAHVHAVEVYQRRLEEHGASLEISARREIFRKLVAPRDLQGFGMEPSAARAEALRLVKDEPVPSAVRLVKRLEILRLLERFMTKPIREKGLGFGPERIDAELEAWVTRFDRDEVGTYEVERFINNYGTALVAYLTEAARAGAYDEVAARDWARAFSSGEISDLRAELRAAGYEADPFDRMPDLPSVKPVRAPTFSSRAAACLRALLARRT